MLQTTKTLCALSGVSGWEDEVRDYILQRALPLADEVETDAMGNLYIFKKGAVTPSQSVMVCAHMDEVGIIVTGITDDGYLRFDFVGGVDRRVVLGKRVFIGPKGIPGVIGLKPKHLCTAEEMENIVPALETLYVDIGAEDADGARSAVRLGDRGVFAPEIVEFGNGFLKGKALDDRVGCAAMLKVMEQDLPIDTWFVFTVQEEVGCRGAGVAAEKIRPGHAVILEGTTAADVGGVASGQEICFLGRGAVIPFMDRGTIAPLINLMHDIVSLNGAMSRLAGEGEDRRRHGRLRHPASGRGRQGDHHFRAFAEHSFSRQRGEDQRY